MFMENEELPRAITVKKMENFSKWYDQAIAAAGLIDKRYNVKGMFVWLNYGLETMKIIKDTWDGLFKKSNIKEMYFPLIIPMKYAQQNSSWFEGFKSEAFWVKTMDENNASHILRPTGEPAMYPMFSLWIRTKNDLPLRIYETVSSFRYETKHTMPIIRDREITIWHEIHTAHESKEEAEEEAKLHIKLNDQIWENLALEPLRVNKPLWEC